MRQTGIAFNRQKAHIGAGSVAVGIRDNRGEVVAGLGLVYPSHLVSEEEIKELIVHIRKAGQEISQRMGGSGA